MSKNERSMTDDITCPYCDHEYYDSVEFIPIDSDGEITWDEECPECDKKFYVAFDCRNMDSGFTTRRTECEFGNHTYKVYRECSLNKYWDNPKHISKFYRGETCTECDDTRLTPVKEDGSDFTKEELLAFKSKIRMSKRAKTHLDFKGEKIGHIETSYQFGTPKAMLKTEDPGGNAKIWVDLCRSLIKKGFKPMPLVDYLRGNTCRLKRGWVEIEVSLHNHAVSAEIYQNIIQKSREEGDGRYEETYRIITEPMKVRVRANILMIVRHFENLGFEFSPDLNDVQKLLKKLKVEKFEDHKDPENHYNPRELTDRDGKSMKSGDIKYYYDRGILKRGEIWWNNGNQWYALSNGTLDYCSFWDFFDADASTPIKKPLTKDQQVQRLYSELKRAESNHNYDKCKPIYKLICSHKLYRVWSIKHDQWWGPNNRGYTPEKENAGVYTHENITLREDHYNNGVDSEAIEIK